MKKYSKFLSLFFVAALTVCTFFWLQPSDSKYIKKRIYQACSTVGKSADENPAVAAFKMFDFASLCANSVTFAIEGAPFQGAMSNEVFISELTRYRALCQKIVIEPLDLEVDIVAPNNATAKCVVKAQIKGNSFDFEEIRHFQIKFIKTDNAWKFLALDDDGVLKR